MWTKEIEELMQQGDVPGLSLAVLRDGAIVWNQPFGQKNAISDPKTDGPVRADTLFPACSLSKPVFAYIVLRLAERGTLDLDTPIYEYLPNKRLEHDDRYKRITARLVLSHTTGLPNWGGTPLTFRFPPGERFGYSGEGFVYLQAVVERLTCQPLEDLAQQEVFGPLRMTRSTFVWSPALADNLVTGYRGGTEPQVIADPNASSAGSLLTTSEDYARFVLAILDGTGLQKESAEQMLTVHIPAPRERVPSGVFWGLGWGLEESDSGPYFWQWGDNFGFKCFVIASRPKRHGVVYFTNTQEGLSIVTPLVTSILGGKHPSLDWNGYDKHDSPKVIAWKELVRVYKQQGAEAGLARYREWHQQAPDVVEEDFTNNLAYCLKDNGKQDVAPAAVGAIALFQENVRNYPQSSNTYDSLGWTYLFADRVELALANMEAALALENEERAQGREAKVSSAHRESLVAWLREYLHRQKEAASVPVATLERYVGSYKEHRIAFKDGDLYCENMANNRFGRLVPISEDTFVQEGEAWIHVRFIRDKGEKASKIIVLTLDDRQEDRREEVVRNPE